jgi:hypothetical protein
MKESFFYKKTILLKAIRTPKEYPFIQIYSALTQLIEDENEFITDKYGRNGRLINIGEYYLFQPIELRDKNASIFDRSVPIDYKHDMIQFTINKNINKSVIDNRHINMADEMDNVPKMIAEMQTNFNICREFSKKTKVPRGDDNWYKHCGIVLKKMSKEYPDSKEYLISYIVAHMLELLLFEEKLEVMNYLYGKDNINQGTFEWIAKEYFEINSIITNNFTAYVLYNINKRIIVKLNENNVWVVADPSEQIEIATAKETKKFLTLKSVENKEGEDYNKIIGFIGYEKSNRYLVFKTKDMTSKRDTGARCDESGKVKILNKLNIIIGKETYTNENTKLKKDSAGNVMVEAVGHLELCILQEFILRFFTTIKKDNKKWFFTPEMAIWHKFYTIFSTF